MNVKKANHEGFSLTELIIAMAITSIVMLSVVGLIGYGSRSMNITQAKVALQDQAKDGLNHISAYAMEADKADADAANKILVLTQTQYADGGTPDSVKLFFYWQDGNAIYFADSSVFADKSALTADKKYLLVEDVDDFQCEVKEDENTGKKILHIDIKMKDDISEFDCSKDIFMRNQ